MSNHSNPDAGKNALHETSQLRQIWLEMARWTRIGAAMTVVYLVLTAVFIFFINNRISGSVQDNDALFQNRLTAFFLICTLLGLPAWYNYQFSRLIQRGLIQQDTTAKNQAFRYLKLNFSFYGILNLIYIGLFLFLMVIGIFVIAATSGTSSNPTY